MGRPESLKKNLRHVRDRPSVTLRHHAGAACPSHVVTGSAAAGNTLIPLPAARQLWRGGYRVALRSLGATNFGGGIARIARANIFR